VNYDLGVSGNYNSDFIIWFGFYSPDSSENPFVFFFKKQKIVTNSGK